MARAYSANIRKKVVSYVEAGHTRLRASKVFGIDYTTVCRWCKMYKNIGEDTTVPRQPRQPREHRKIDPEVLRADLKANPNATLKELADRYDCTEGSISRMVNQLRLKRKNHCYKIDPILLKKYTDKYPNITDKKLAEKFDCTEEAVRLARKRHGIVCKNL